MLSDYVPGASVTIQVNGYQLREYETEPPGDNVRKTVAAYVESSPGAQFSLNLTIGAAFPYLNDCIQMAVSLDGTQVRADVFSPRIIPLCSIECVIEHKAGIDTLRKFAFAEHRTTDESTEPAMREKLAHLGQIQVQLTRCRLTGIAVRPQDSVAFISPVGSGVPEKALKGQFISNHAALGVGQKTFANWQDVDFPYGTDPIATYVFCYRTHQDLQREGIIEATPPPLPLEERDLDTLSLEEARELLRRGRVKQERTVAVKDEARRTKRPRSGTSTASAPSGSNTPDDADDEVEVAGRGQGKRARREAVAESLIYRPSSADAGMAYSWSDSKT